MNVVNFTVKCNWLKLASHYTSLPISKSIGLLSGTYNSHGEHIKHIKIMVVSVHPSAKHNSMTIEMRACLLIIVNRFMSR